MKILKPGKVEQRKFVCERCGCEFVADQTELSYSLDYYVLCPCCKNKLWEHSGEPYEEPTPTQTDRERLAELITAAPNKHVVTWREAAGTIADRLIRNGVTFREG